MVKYAATTFRYYGQSPNRLLNLAASLLLDDTHWQTGLLLRFDTK
jgi:hypothetical protein